MLQWSLNGFVWIIIPNVRATMNKLNLEDFFFFFSTDSILIYGMTLESYCCINALLTNGIPANAIKLIYPPEHHNVRQWFEFLFSIIIRWFFKTNVFNDPTVLKTVQDQLKDLKIEIYENYLMDEWHSHGIIDMNQPIENVIFRTKDKTHGKDLKLKCTVRFSFDKHSLWEYLF